MRISYVQVLSKVLLALHVKGRALQGSSSPSVPRQLTDEAHVALAELQQVATVLGHYDFEVGCYARLSGAHT